MNSDLIRKEEHRYTKQPSSFQSINVKHTLYQRIMVCKTIEQSVMNIKDISDHYRSGSNYG